MNSGRGGGELARLQPWPAWPFATLWPDLVLSACRCRPGDWRPAAAAKAGVAEDAGLLRAVPRRRAEYLVGRLCARQALRDLVPGAPALAPARRPDGGPDWPASVVGAISHGGGWAVALVGRRERWQGLGVDVEALLPESQLAELMPFFMTAAERARLPAGRRALAATLCFSLKESLMKVLLPSRDRPLDFLDLEVQTLELDHGRAWLRDPTGRGVAGLWSAWPAGAGGVLTVCGLPSTTLSAF